MTENRRTYDPYAPPPAAATVGISQPSAVEDESPRSDATVSGQKSPVPDDLAEISRADLIALAERYGVASYGSKAEIAERVRRATDGG